MSRLLSNLDSRFYPRACELIALSAEAGLPLFIIFTSRTEAEQAALYAQGRTKPGLIVTWTLDSKHVIKPSRPGALAIDLCPYEIYQIAGPDKLQWNSSDPAWKKMGEIGVNLGLRWGATWKVATGPIHSKPDWGHFELMV